MKTLLIRTSILGLSLVYGNVLLVGAGLLTGGGHGAMILAPLGMGPLGCIPAYFSSAFHNTYSPLIHYAPSFDKTISILAILEWPVLAALAMWGLRRSFLIVIALYYISILMDWIHTWLAEGMASSTFISGSLVCIFLYFLFFLAGQRALWKILSNSQSAGAGQAPPPNRS